MGNFELTISKGATNGKPFERYRCCIWKIPGTRQKDLSTIKVISHRFRSNIQCGKKTEAEKGDQKKGISMHMSTTNSVG